MIYVGKAKNLRKRVSSYFTKSDLGEKTRMLVSQIRDVRTVVVQSEIESFLLEERLIKKYKPKYNIKLTDGKAYPLIRITVKDEYPKVLLARKEDDPKSLYFGPYTSSGSLKMVLKLIRKIIPYQSTLNHPKGLCLYYHLGLCPCPSTLTGREYRKNIKSLINFLNGDTKKVIRDFENEREISSKEENFEQASMIQKRIEAIKLITSPFYKPFEYESNPNLRDDVLQMELSELKNILNSNNVPVSNLGRIECYDISNIQGKNATASMVVLTNGERDTSQYRRFKIRMEYKGGKPNDFAMMQEVLTRRLKHDEWEKPGLIVVDGGKGQVSAATEVIEENIPLIGLAKREETIITRDLQEIKLPKDSKALQLIMKIRDEAHRFAITYHRKLRSKSFLP